MLFRGIIGSAKFNNQISNLVISKLANEMLTTQNFISLPSIFYLFQNMTFI